MTRRIPTLGSLMGAALVVAVATLVPGRLNAGDCVSLSPAEMFLDPNYELPDGEPGLIEIQTPALGPIQFPPRGGAVVSLQILPPQMNLPEHAFVPGEDYTACLDPATGSGTIDFRRIAPYVVRAGYADGHFDHYEISVIAVSSAPIPHRTAGAKVVWTEISIPENAQGYSGAGFTVDNNGYTVKPDLGALVTQIKADFMSAGKMDIALRYHGAPEQLTFKKGQWMGPGHNGSPNFTTFCDAVRFRVKSITLLSCQTALGPKGCQFIKDLSACAGNVPVYASTGKVKVIPVGDPPKPTAVTNGAMTSNSTCQ